MPALRRYPRTESRRPLAPLASRGAVELPAERAPKMREIGKAELRCHVGHLCVGSNQHAPRALHASRRRIRVRREARCGAEETLEMEWAHRGRIRHFAQARRIVQRALDQRCHTRETAYVEPSANTLWRTRAEVPNGDMNDEVVHERLDLRIRQWRSAERGRSIAGAECPGDQVAVGL